jgi:hypothetical protein
VLLFARNICTGKIQIAYESRAENKKAAIAPRRCGKKRQSISGEQIAAMIICPAHGARIFTAGRKGGVASLPARSIWAALPLR